MLCGVDQLFTGQLSGLRRRLRGSRLGVLTHAAAVDRRGRHLLSVLEELGASPRLIFAPEHGLDATAHSRINTVFMTSFFVGGAVGSFAGVLCWGWGGWPLVCGQILLWLLIAIAIAVVNVRLAGRANPVSPPPVS